MDKDTESITQLLEAWRDGNELARERVTPLLYQQLQRIAAHQMREERADHTLEPSALVHEAYMRLDSADLPWKDRQHFLAIAAEVMRRVLVDHARARNRDKRGGGAAKITLHSNELAADTLDVDIIALDEALDELAAQDPRKARIVELTYFGGLTYPEVAELLDLSKATVHRELQFSRAWLNRALA